MAKYKAYPEYKDSGVEWLGDIPSHWDCTALKRLCSLITGLTPPTQNEDNYADEGYPWVRPEDLNESGFGTHASKYVSDIGWKLLRHIKPNSTLICCIGTIGKCGYVKETVSTNQQITAATFRDCERFNYYLLQAARAQLEELATGNVLKILNSERLGALNVVKVNRKEADTIAEFLDHETTKIDDLIEKQQQLIELLKEKRQAVISHAVTKGLNPDVPMKDSGVEWLGDVPEHWTISRYKFCTSRVIVGIAEAATHAYSDSGTPIIRSTNIKEEGLNTTDLLYLKNEFARQNESKYLFSNDIVTVRTGYPGISAVIPETLNGSHCFTNLISTPLHSQHAKYLTEYLNSAMGKEYFALNGWGSAQKNISVPILQNFPIAYPDSDEQREISTFVIDKRDEFSHLLEKADESIRLMLERRTALISAAVTGKIDVRDWVAPDTQDLEEPQEATA